MVQFENLVRRLEALQYSEQVTDRLNQLRSRPDSAEVRLIDIRTILEKFLEETARLSIRYGGPKFTGDFSRPVVIRAFLQEGCWITKEEFEFISSFYGLMSSSDGHGRDSMLDPLAAKHLCWSVIDTISHRILNRPKRPGTTRGQDKIEQALANEFVEALRAGKSEGRAFEPTFTESTMKKVRQRLTNSDTELLWRLMDNAGAHPELRNRAASLLLGERLLEHPTEQGRVAEDMRRYYDDNNGTAPWQLLRGIALALSNQTGDATYLRDYLSVIGEDHELLELNLLTTDKYYGTSENAISIFLRRSSDSHRSTARCIWELFYVSRRVLNDKERAIRAIEKRAKKTEDFELKSFCLDCAAYLKQNN